MNIETDLSLPEDLDTDVFVSRLTLFNNSSYNLHSFIQESVYLGKNSSLKMVCIK